MSDSAVHVAGLVAVLVAAPALLAYAATQAGDVRTITAVSVYCATLVAMILFSALYNMLRHTRFTPVLRRLDHAAIYFKIAGTYTPFALLSGAPAAFLLGMLWFGAALGTVLRVLVPHRFRWVAFGLYLGMGWAGVVAGWPVLTALSAPVLALIVIGGCLYTFGTVFYLAKNMPFQRTVWHVFVLLASVMFYLAVVMQVGQTAVSGN
ncbi:PAQR family membrane homeostasis protein TrhA [Halodurantibacterium flavum]|uniref:Hemolysin III family protein n=1 Tax=Halodurantibacterium flavum TaxID=1382802 RepID=A0ABW4S3T1_9RHOB